MTTAYFFFEIEVEQKLLSFFNFERTGRGCPFKVLCPAPVLQGFHASKIFSRSFQLLLPRFLLSRFLLSRLLLQQIRPFHCLPLLSQVQLSLLEQPLLRILQQIRPLLNLLLPRILFYSPLHKHFKKSWTGVNKLRFARHFSVLSETFSCTPLPSPTVLLFAIYVMPPARFKRTSSTFTLILSNPFFLSRN